MIMKEKKMSESKRIMTIIKATNVVNEVIDQKDVQELISFVAAAASRAEDAKRYVGRFVSGVNSNSSGTISMAGDISNALKDTLSHCQAATGYLNKILKNR